MFILTCLHCAGLCVCVCVAWCVLVTGLISSTESGRRDSVNTLGLTCSRTQLVIVSNYLL